MRGREGAGVCACCARRRMCVCEKDAYVCVCMRYYVSWNIHEHTLKHLFVSIFVLS